MPWTQLPSLGSLGDPSHSLYLGFLHVTGVKLENPPSRHPVLAAGSRAAMFVEGWSQLAVSEVDS